MSTTTDLRAIVADRIASELRRAGLHDAAALATPDAAKSQWESIGLAVALACLDTSESRAIAAACDELSFHDNIAGAAYYLGLDDLVQP